MAKSPTETDIVVGHRIKLRRKELGKSQERLSEEIGVTFQQVQKYEKGANRVGASRLKDVARALGVSVTYFFPEDTGHETSPIYTHLDVPGAADLVACYARIGDPVLRRAVLNLARALSRDTAGREDDEAPAPISRNGRLTSN